MKRNNFLRILLIGSIFIALAVHFQNCGKSQFQLNKDAAVLPDSAFFSLNTNECVPVSTTGYVLESYLESFGNSPIVALSSLQVTQENLFGWVNDITGQIKIDGVLMGILNPMGSTNFTRDTSLPNLSYVATEGLQYKLKSAIANSCVWQITNDRIRFQSCDPELSGKNLHFTLRRDSTNSTCQNEWN